MEQLGVQLKSRKPCLTWLAPKRLFLSLSPSLRLSFSASSFPSYLLIRSLCHSLSFAPTSFTRVGQHAHALWSSGVRPLGSVVWCEERQTEWQWQTKHQSRCWYVFVTIFLFLRIVVIHILSFLPFALFGFFFVASSV